MGFNSMPIHIAFQVDMTQVAASKELPGDLLPENLEMA